MPCHLQGLRLAFLIGAEQCFAPLCAGCFSVQQIFQGGATPQGRETHEFDSRKRKQFHPLGPGVCA